MSVIGRAGFYDGRLSDMSGETCAGDGGCGSF